MIIVVQNQVAESQKLVSSHGFNYGVKHFYADQNNTLSNTLESTLSIDRTRAEFLLNLGSIYVNGHRIDSKKGLDQPIPLGALLRVHTTPRRHHCDYNWLERIVYDHPDFIVLNKPSGIPSHASVDNIVENSLTQTEHALNQSLFISHRLDSLTEGLIIYGKNKKFVQSFNDSLSKHQIQKKYVALTEKGPALLQNKKQHLIHYMKPDPRAPKVIDHIAHPTWLMCELEITQQRAFDADTWFMQINLLTGRTHQIRTQLAFEGCSILGDQIYGSTRSVPGSELGSRIALKAQEIRFTYEGKEFLFTLDEDFKF